MLVFRFYIYFQNTYYVLFVKRNHTR
uniref:Uncharacterized protein n=1 Tax=Anguilla anguilla TaxID=7936 RepID=A0A0E9PTB7_ANGAN